MSDGTRAVAIGGGTGLPLVLSCLAGGGCDVTAIVTMADDGGSSGRLREELGILPPGDIRNCLVALAPTGSALARLFQYRFAAGEGLRGHALGNLIIAALTDSEGGFAQAIETAQALLGVKGRVLPCTLADVRLLASDETGAVVHGQARVARSERPIRRVCLEPEAPEAYPPAIEAIEAADLVVIGPGSLYTSIIPNLLVDGVTDALGRTAGRIVYVCNVANQRGETTGMDAYEHVEALLMHGLPRIDVVIAHDTEHTAQPAATTLVDAGSEVLERIRSLGPDVIVSDLVDADDPFHHDPALLCAVLRRLASCRSLPR